MKKPRHPAGVVAPRPLSSPDALAAVRGGFVINGNNEESKHKPGT